MSAKRTKHGGRKKGTPNKINAEMREHLGELVAGTAPKLQGWMDAVAKDDPAKAFDIFVKMAEFVIPKLARTEFIDEKTKACGPTEIKIHWVSPLPRTALDDIDPQTAKNCIQG